MESEVGVTEIVLLPLFVAVDGAGIGDEDGDLGLFRLSVRLSDGSSDSFTVAHGEDLSKKIPLSRPFRTAKDHLAPILVDGILDLSSDRVAEFRASVLREAVRAVVRRLGRDVPTELVVQILHEEMLVGPVMGS